MALRTRVAAVVCVFGMALSVLEASQIRSLDLGQMTQRAARIFSGRCLRSQVVFDPTVGAEVAVATFRVDRAVKGVVDRTVTVRMSMAASTDVPAFREGEDVVLFLYGDGPLGLTAPVGLGQGRFEVVTDKLGVKRAINPFGNDDLVRGGGRKAKAAEIADPDALLDRVEQIVAGP